MITIVDYGMGNLGSIKNMFKKIGVDSDVTGDIDSIERASKLLLPGVGAFDAAMQRIDEMGLREVLNKKALVEKVPVLGICLGMQLLVDRSEEGTREGLGWIEGEAKKFSFPGSSNQHLKVPHMGWNGVSVANETALTNSFDDDFRFYFVHSYFVEVGNDDHIMLTTDYGINFHSGISKGNIYGAQFHPEKSHRYGMQLLSNFANL